LSIDEGEFSGWCVGFGAGCPEAVAGEVDDLGIEVEEGALDVAGADGPAGLQGEAVALGGALEAFGDVADFLVEAEGGGALGVGGEDEEGGLGYGSSSRGVCLFIPFALGRFEVIALHL
jgi:hypothetical protein